MTKLQYAREGLRLLREARNCFARAGAPRTMARVRLAITSAGGAVRHASLEPYRLARRAQKEEQGK